MECNRDEAIRAKSMAEFMLERDDFSSAMKFALKAQRLYPEIEGISKMVSMIQVYLSAERKVGGEVDWYGVLRVGPTADDETITKHYKRLALEMHPDKNSSAGASGAFKLISEAKCLLLDSQRRSAYDRIAGYQRVPEASGPSARADSARAPPDVPFSASDFISQEWAREFPNWSKVEENRPKKPARTSQNNDQLFWTVCRRCRTHFLYPRMFRNIMIICRGCENVFVAIEVPGPVSGPKPWSNARPPFGHGNFEAGSSSRTPTEQAGPKKFGVFEAQQQEHDLFGPGVFEAQQQDPPHGVNPSGAGAAPCAESDTLWKRRRMDEGDDGNGRRHVLGSREIGGCYDDDVDSVYASW